MLTSILISFALIGSATPQHFKGYVPTEDAARRYAEIAYEARFGRSYVKAVSPLSVSRMLGRWVVTAGPDAGGGNKDAVIEPWPLVIDPMFGTIVLSGFNMDSERIAKHLRVVPEATHGTTVLGKDVEIVLNAFTKHRARKDVPSDMKKLASLFVSVRQISNGHEVSFRLADNSFPDVASAQYTYKVVAQ